MVNSPSPSKKRESGAPFCYNPPMKLVLFLSCLFLAFGAFAEAQLMVDKHRVFHHKTFDVHHYHGNTGNHGFKFRHYVSKLEGPRPLLLVLPNITPIQTVENLLASYFARRGYNVLVINHGDYLTSSFEAVSGLNDFLQKQLDAIKLTLDMVMAKNEITEVSTFGFSLGAVLSTYELGLDPRITKGIIYLGGDNFDRETNFVKTVKKVTHKTNNNFKLFLDFMDMTDTIKTKKVKMYMAKKDSYIPYEGQLTLWEKLDRPEFQTYNHGHVFTAVHSLSRFDEFYEFLERTVERK